MLAFFLLSPAAAMQTEAYPKQREIFPLSRHSFAQSALANISMESWREISPGPHLDMHHFHCPIFLKASSPRGFAFARIWRFVLEACVVEPSGVGLNETNQVQLITTGTCGSAVVVQVGGAQWLLRCAHAACLSHDARLAQKKRPAFQN